MTKNSRLGLGGLVLLIAFASTGCGQKVAAQRPEEQQSAVVEVATVNPVKRDLVREVIQPGYLRPYEQTPIYTKIAGFAKEPRFDIGDRVKKDELMVEVYVPEVVQDLKVKAARIDQAKADLKQSKEAALAAKAGQESARADIQAKLASIKSAEAQVQRWQAEDVRARDLVARKIYDQQTADEVVNQLRASEALLDEAKARYTSAQANFDQAAAHFHKTEADVEVAAASVSVAEATYEQWKDWLSYAEIKSPFDGVVTLRNVHKGHFLQPSNSGSTSKAAEPLFVVMRTDIMRCTIEVPELDALLVHDHDKVIVRFQAMPGVETEGEVTRSSYSLDERSRTLRVEVHLKNPDSKLQPGMYASVSILAKVKNVWTLPNTAIMNDILADGDRSYCYQVVDGKAVKTFLEIGTRTEDGVQVLRKQRGKGAWQEITGNEAVVVTNPKSLQDGQEVKLQTAKSPE
jgi:RND family efflux transporter MFP subunit